MVMQRYDPSQNVVSLRAMMDRLFDESFLRPFANVSADGERAVPVDVTEADDAYTVIATMPGVRPEDVQITAHGNIVTIRGETQA